MSLDATMNAWNTWLAGQAAPISTPLRFKHSPPWPYAGAYPYVILMPRTQTRYRYSNVEIYNAGWWRLMFVDLVGATFTSVGDLLANAAAWAEAVAAALQANETNRSLGGAVDYVGESDAGEGGIVTQWDDKSVGLDTNDTPFWGLPLDAFVRELPEPG